MRKIVKLGLFLFALMLVPRQKVLAQDIQVHLADEFVLEKDYGIDDKLMKSCALFIIHSNKNISVDADVTIIKKQKRFNPDVTLLYVSPSTSNLMISYKDYIPVLFSMPTELIAGNYYDLYVNVSKQKQEETQQPTNAVSSSDIMLSGFRFNPHVIEGNRNPIYDNAGNKCAIIRYFINDDNFEVLPNLGAVKTQRMPGQIIQYVPVGTKRLTIKNGNYMPLSSYEIPMKIEGGQTYDVTISLLDSAVKRQKAAPDLDVYLGVGYNGTMNFDSNGGRRDFSIHCNSDWVVSAPSWCKLSDSSGSGNLTITIDLKVNSSDRKRTGIIAIRAGDITATINVEQK